MCQSMDGGPRAKRRRTSAAAAAVSVVVPAHNAAAWLPECLASIAAQTFPHDALEVCLCDDASTDGTREILEEWAHHRFPAAGIRCVLTQTADAEDEEGNIDGPAGVGEASRALKSVRKESCKRLDLHPKQAADTSLSLIHI